jgi:hypothetical protein
MAYMGVFSCGKLDSLLTFKYHAHFSGIFLKFVVSAGPVVRSSRYVCNSRKRILMIRMILFYKTNADGIGLKGGKSRIKEGGFLGKR